MERRTFLRSGVPLVGAGVLAGCLETFGLRTQSAWRDPPLVEDRPNAVYHPSVTEGAAMYGMATADDCAIALMYSYPHRFWVVTGNDKNKIVVKDDDSLHLMASVWEQRSATTLPTNVSIEIRQNGETVDKRSPWPMLSPTMGFHYGDNISLNSEGNYTARMAVEPMQVRRIGALDGTLTETRTVEIPFEFDTNDAYSLPIHRFDEKAGTNDAPELLTMKRIPQGIAPAKDDMPGTIVGEASSGKGRAKFVVTVVENGSQAPNGQSYMAISARTPYNRVVLPFMFISATISRNGNGIFTTPLRSAVGPTLKHHYGTAVGSVESGDVLTITPQTPPQTARHDGYETAFIDMSSVQITL